MTLSHLLKFKCQNFIKILLQRKCTNQISLGAVRNAFRYSTVVDLSKLRGHISMDTTTYGQPTPSTHPHLLKQNELTPGITLKEYQERRFRLIMAIQKYTRDNVQAINPTKKNHLIIIPSSTKKYMSARIPYTFRQHSDFLYLTGCLEPDSVLVMSADCKNIITTLLFIRPKDPAAELWEGSRTGVENALDMFGVDETYSMDEFSTEIGKRFQSENTTVWYDSNSSDLRKITEEVKQLTMGGVNSPTNFIQSMRLFKSTAEQQLMRHTCNIASQAINEVMQEIRPGVTEHQICAMLDYKCRMRDASYLAYPPVVATGKNATIIHYLNNMQVTRGGELVLMDAGCEYGGYASDITRTFPVNGYFSQEQKILYDVVLNLQNDLFGILLQKGGDTLDNLFITMCVKMGKYLQEAGLVPKDIADDFSYAKAGNKFCPHHVSHYLGMDVHDTPLIPRMMRLSPGMVFTVEPGIYIGFDRKDVPKKFRGIGVRIEDDVLVTEDNQIEILTESCAKKRSSLAYISI